MNTKKRSKIHRKRKPMIIKKKKLWKRSLQRIKKLLKKRKNRS